MQSLLETTRCIMPIAKPVDSSQSYGLLNKTNPGGRPTAFGNSFGSKPEKSTDNGLVGVLQSAHPSHPQPGQLTVKLERLKETRERQPSSNRNQNKRSRKLLPGGSLATAFSSAATSAIAGMLKSKVSHSENILKSLLVIDAEPAPNSLKVTRHNW